ncbi:MAG: hypothetical protein LBE81_06710 [Azonexus sp.]|uniref:hypothetical protein n=1 Tax=Azonexus sp. TaxID=1872668 RepID=UPI00282CD7BE|nr:hypothetical protein [Azonexus sp.]MDR0776313.1 hypothetical protein [Azonexus sp.]
MNRFFLLGALGVALSLPVAATELSCPDLATLVQVNGCPTEEELQYTYVGYCSDNAKAYGNQMDPCADYADYRKLKNLALWESADGQFTGYLSCDLPEAEWRTQKPTGIALAMQGKITKVVCSYPQSIKLTYRSRETCTVADAKACADNAAACRATCN